MFYRVVSMYIHKYHNNTTVGVQEKKMIRKKNDGKHIKCPSTILRVSPIFVKAE